jgi:hypothetical protein
MFLVELVQNIIYDAITSVKGKGEVSDLFHKNLHNQSGFPVVEGRKRPKKA